MKKIVILLALMLVLGSLIISGCTEIPGMGGDSGYQGSNGGQDSDSGSGNYNSGDNNRNNGDSGDDGR